MKKFELRQIIREEVRKVIKENRYEQIAKTLKFDEADVVKYNVGKGERMGAPVDVNDLEKVLPSITMKTINLLKDSGIKFKSAYANIRTIEKSYLGTGSGVTLTYSMIGKDAKGNEIIYDKYEGQTAGGGQAFVFVNGRKWQASAYLQELGY